MSKWLDFSSNSNTFFPIYVKGFVDVSGGDIITRNGNVYAGADASINKRLFVGGDASFNGKLSVGGDVSLNGNLYLNSNSLYVNGALFSGGSSNFASDVSMNKRLFVGGDASFGGNLITGNVTSYSSLTTYGIDTNPNNYASTYTQLTSSNGLTSLTSILSNYQSCSMSGNGNYILVAAYNGGSGTNSRIYLSTDGGNNFSVITALGTYKWVGVTVSNTGQFMMALNANSTVQLSRDYGVNWTDLTAGNAILYGPGTQVSYTNATISSDGQYIFLTTSNNKIFLSNNNGGSFPDVYNPTTGGPGGMSDNGNYLAFVVNSGYFYLSKNRGGSWITTQNTNITGLPFATTAGYKYVSISTSGKYIMIVSDTYAYISTNYGDSFYSYAIGGVYCAISYDEQIMAVSTGSQLYLSSNYGINFSLKTVPIQFSAALSNNGSVIVTTSSDSLYKATTPYKTYAISGFTAINHDVSLNAKLGVAGDVNFSGNLRVGGNLYLKSNSLYVNGATFSGGSTNFTTDVSMNSRLMVLGDASLNGKLGVSGDVSFNNRMYVFGDVSLNGNVFVGRDLSVNGNLIAVTQGSADNSNKVATTAYVTQAISTGTTNVRSLVDLSINAGFYNRQTIDASINAGYYNRQTIDASINAGYYNRQTIDASINSNYYNRQTIDASINSNYYNRSAIDASINSNYYNRSTIDSTFYNRQTIDASINAGYYNRSAIDASINASFAKLSGSTFTGPVALTNAADLSMNSRLFVGSDASFGGSVNVANDVLIKGRLYVQQYSNVNILNTTTTNYTFILAEDISLNGRLLVSGDSSFNGNVFVGRDLSVNGNLVAVTQGSADNSNKVATTAYVTQAVSTGTTNTRSLVDASINTNYYNRSTIDSSINTNYYNRSTIDSSINTNYYNRSTIDSSINTNYYNRSTIDSSINTNYYNRSTIDSSINTNYYNRSIIDASINTSYYNRQTIDASINTNYYNKQTLDASINAGFYNRSIIDTSINTNYYNKQTLDSSINAGFYNRSIIDTSINTNYYNRQTIDASINTNYYNRQTIDASININYYNRQTIDASININYYNRSIIDASINTNYYNRSIIDASINASFAKLSGSTFTGPVILSSAADLSMNSRLFVGGDASLNARLVVRGDASFNGRIFVASDLSVNGNLFVSGDLSLNGNLNLKINSLYAGGSTFTPGGSNFTSDVSMNNRLFVFGDVSMNSNLNINGKTFITGDASLNGNVIVNNNPILDFTNNFLNTWSSTSLAGATVFMSQTGQYQTYNSGTSSQMFSSTYGASFYNITAANAELSSDQVDSMNVSGNGQYLLYVPRPNGGSLNIGYIFVSNNYGLSGSWTKINMPYTYYWRSPSISFTGQYQSISGTTVPPGSPWYGFRSADFGNTWTQSSYSNVGLQMSSSGQYQIQLVSNTLYFSNDYGANWSTTGYFSYMISISSSGQYIRGVYNNTIYSSSTYGSNWYSTTFTTSTTITASHISMSLTAQYQALTVNTTDVNRNKYYPVYIYGSSDFGNTWNNKYTITGPNTYSFDSFTATYMSSDCKYIYCSIFYHTAFVTLLSTSSFFNNYAAFNTDVSMNGKLAIVGDVSLNARLFVRGNTAISGTLTKGAGSFDIAHPDPSKPSGTRLRHCFIEGPTRGDNIYRFKVATSNLSAIQLLPSYYKFLNEDTQIWVNPINCLGAGYGVLQEDNQTINITVSVDGNYNVLVMGTRKDQLAIDFFDNNGGAEYTA